MSFFILFFVNDEKFKDSVADLSFIYIYNQKETL